jgi:hypothetical protein
MSVNFEHIQGHHILEDSTLQLEPQISLGKLGD